MNDGASSRRLSVLIPTMVATVLWPVVGLFGGMAAMMSPMLYDAPGSEENGLITVVIVGAVSLPVLCLVSTPASVWCAVKEWRGSVNRRWALVWAGLPLVSVAIVLVGFVLMEVICDGQLQCDGL